MFNVSCSPFHPVRSPGQSLQPCKGLCCLGFLGWGSLLFALLVWEYVLIGCNHRSDVVASYSSNLMRWSVAIESGDRRCLALVFLPYW